MGKVEVDQRFGRCGFSLQRRSAVTDRWCDCCVSPTPNSHLGDLLFWGMAEGKQKVELANNFVAFIEYSGFEIVRVTLVAAEVTTLSPASYRGHIDDCEWLLKSLKHVSPPLLLSPHRIS